MKCAACNYEYDVDYILGETIGDEDFIKIYINGTPHETNKYREDRDGFLERKFVDLYGCPKCGTIKFEYK